LDRWILGVLGRERRTIEEEYDAYKALVNAGGCITKAGQKELPAFLAKAGQILEFPDILGIPPKPKEQSQGKLSWITRMLQWG
jgi:hypothetical protein